MTTDVQSNHPSVFHFSDYRLFLRAYYRFRKNTKSHWSYGVWARKLNIRSTATLAMILSGERNPGPELLKAFSASMGLSPEEAEYFTSLVEFEKSPCDSTTRVLLREKLSQYQRIRYVTELNPDVFAEVAWHFSTIREMVRMIGFVNDAEWIQRRLQFDLSKAEIEKAIQTLVRQGLLNRNKEGRLTISGGHIIAPIGAAQPWLRHFHEQALDNAKASLKKCMPSDRDISSIAFAMTKNKLPDVRKLIRKFKDELYALAEPAGADCVYQIVIALHPVAFTQMPKNE